MANRAALVNRREHLWDELRDLAEAHEKAPDYMDRVQRLHLELRSVVAEIEALSVQLRLRPAA